MSRRSFMDQKGDDSSNVQVIISSSSSHGISKQTKQAPTSSSSHQYNIGEMDPEQLSSLKEVLLNHVSYLTWNDVKPLYDHNPELVRIPLTVNEDTPLHFAVRVQRNDFVRGFVNYHVTRQDLEIPNADGNTAFCLAAMTGQSDILEIMIQKNEDLPLIHGKHGMLPVHMAALGGYHETVQHLSVQNLLEKMDRKDIERLFFMALNSNMYDVANKLLDKYPEHLTIARDDEENLTALHMLARRKPLEKNNHNKEDLQWDMLFKLWTRVAKLEHQRRWKLITEPSILLFDAVKSGNIFVLTSLCYERGDLDELLMIKDHENGHNLLHIAVLFRQNRIIDFILKDMWYSKLFIKVVDKDRNNVLHYAARQPEEASLSLRADIRMQSELDWFKGMEKRVPPELRTMRNKHGMTPNDMFYANHRKLSDEVKDTEKAVAESGMVVAALVVAVAFAAALTTPGDETNAWFVVFIMANAASLFTSALSIVAFLSIFTSSTFKEGKFTTSLYPNLIIGKRLLFISLVTMVIAFAAACFLIFGDKYKWAAYVVTWFGLLTIIMILQLQLSLSSRYRKCISRIRHHFLGDLVETY